MTKKVELFCKKTEEYKRYGDKAFLVIQGIVSLFRKVYLFAQPKGFIEPHKDNIVIIPANLKKPILQHLRKYHGIYTETIYNDLYGFIRNQDIHGSANTQIYRGLACRNRGDEAASQEEKQKEYEKSIEHYTKAIELKPDSKAAYQNRGNVYLKIREFDSAIADYTELIKQYPDDPEVYFGRGGVYKRQR